MNERPNFDLPTTVVWVACTAIQAANRKTRRHAFSKIKKLARSISETGYFNPILLNENNQIIAGHARLEAAKRLGMAAVPVLYLRGLSDTQVRALRLADNRLAEDAKWDIDLLTLELADLVADDFEIELTGFDIIDVEHMLTPKATGFSDEEDLPLVPDVPVTRLDDCWQCGEHLIGCGDA